MNTLPSFDNFWFLEDMWSSGDSSFKPKFVDHRPQRVCERGFGGIMGSYGEYGSEHFVRGGGGR